MIVWVVVIVKMICVLMICVLLISVQMISDIHVAVAGPTGTECRSHPSPYKGHAHTDHQHSGYHGGPSQGAVR